MNLTSLVGKLPPSAVVELVQLWAFVQKIQVIFQKTPEGQDARWDALQEVLNDNPKYKKYLKIKPSQVIDKLSVDLDVPIEILESLDRDRAIRTQIENVIEIVQRFYKEREKGENNV